MKYKCYKCYEVFDEDEMHIKEYVDWVPYGDTEVPMESYDCFCPYCGAEDPEEHYEEDEEEEDDE